MAGMSESTLRESCALKSAGAGGRWGCISLIGKKFRVITLVTYSAKYQAPMTPAAVVLNTPLATPQLQSHTTNVPTIAQFVQPLTCHSKVEPIGCET